MKKDFSSLGQQLKDRRTELNISLREAQNATSIQMIHLQAIEDGDMSKLISPVYAQGFFKQYSKLLGVDGEKIIRENPELFQYKGNQEFDYGIGTIEMRGTPGASIKWMPNAIWAVGFGALIVVAYFLAKFFEVI